MNKVLMIAALMALAGCQPSARPRNFPVLPDELKDCVFYRITDDNGDAITVARCPNSVTTSKSGGKYPKTAIVVDGGKK